MVCETVWSGEFVQQTRRDYFDESRVPQDSQRLSRLAATVPRRVGRVEAAVSTRAAGRLLHAGAGGRSARTNPRAERAGGSLVKRRRLILFAIVLCVSGV